MTVHTITADSLTDHEYWVSCEWDIIWNGRRYSLGLSPEGRPARQVENGPLIGDRFAWISAQAVMIAAWYPPEPSRLVVEPGDTIIVEGHGKWLVERVERDLWGPIYERTGEPRITAI